MFICSIIPVLFFLHHFYIFMYLLNSIFIPWNHFLISLRCLLLFPWNTFMSTLNFLNMLIFIPLNSSINFFKSVPLRNFTVVSVTFGSNTLFKYFLLFFLHWNFTFKYFIGWVSFVYLLIFTQIPFLLRGKFVHPLYFLSGENREVPYTPWVVFCRGLLR